MKIELKNQIVSRPNYTRIKIASNRYKKGTRSGNCIFINVYPDKLYWYKFAYHPDYADHKKLCIGYSQKYVLSLKNGINIYKLDGKLQNQSNSHQINITRLYKGKEVINYSANERFLFVLKKFCNKHNIKYTDTKNITLFLRSICYSPCKDALNINKDIHIPSIPSYVSGRFRKVQSLKEFQDRYLHKYDLTKLITEDKFINGIQHILCLQNFVSRNMLDQINCVEGIVHFLDIPVVRRFLSNFSPLDIEKMIDEDIFNHGRFYDCLNIYKNWPDMTKSLKYPTFTTFEDLYSDLRSQL